ncbi:type II toxin-antitoxin system HipA family toxin [Knoellia subterranea]|uniref:Phosphatidylinositol kinase n=1 Tax=Knoellia subterranea KCTC 19937 TaxID=1385521 RepID=A0A0A0JIL8_9MICO|nr:type II toxin-antitoxin system HipA family toxin [Knoellia subterranea]KGN36968.1 hypothetical protein N803_16260 [Knoellia subterranea KCTC 19937]
MTPSEPSRPNTRPTEAFVWTWLPGTAEPVVAGRLVRERGRLDFLYGRSYLDRPDAISLYGPELPLRRGAQVPPDGMDVASCLRDGAPDAWGRRVLHHRHRTDPSFNDNDELSVLLRSGSNRFGANDFQASATEFVPRDEPSSMAELIYATDRVIAGEPLPPALADALGHGTSIGGARPKVLVHDGDDQWIGKLSTSTDTMNVVGAEAAAMFLAGKAGVEVAESHVVRAVGRDVLMVRRFDRLPGGGRLHCVSGLTMLGLDERVGRHATYPDLLAVLRRAGSDPRVGEALFDRIAVNIALGNTDDHARNHAAFWDGRALTLTPAYDIAPQPRVGEAANQAMSFGLDLRRESSLPALVEVAHEFGVRDGAARVERIVAAVHDHWGEAAEQARLTAADREFLWGRQILNPAATRSRFTSGWLPDHES